MTAKIKTLTSIAVFALVFSFINISLADTEKSEDSTKALVWQEIHDRNINKLACEVENSTYGEIFEKHSKYVGLLTVDEKSSIGCHRKYPEGQYYNMSFRKNSYCDSGIELALRSISQMYLAMPSFCMADNFLNQVVVLGKEVFTKHGEVVSPTFDRRPTNGELTLTVDVDSSGIVMNGSIRVYILEDSSTDEKDDSVSYDYFYKFSNVRIIDRDI